ncbi:MAG: hypothetical protein QGH73_01230 [Rhodospirillales bacterium]|jgi:hypothetical protein|nr:hypothetical protein [Rhodospirillaceae bacterium]MDP6427780.1 hypothetical protein [Rhodospirillales bacterium]MDP6644586.1 hypothetical protein [Rhodospirillales bacterium]MDP6840280.1 hypothetical protein [Rhodospirillales bacterium]|tara:strand:- start:2105 stop:2626 length:522 start_codon:yes stop_codon:yes gene_type:complete
MSLLLRIVLTLLLIVALALAVLVFQSQPTIQLILAVATVGLAIYIWMAKKLGIKESMQGAENPARMDREAKQLIDIVLKAFNAEGADRIGKGTQGIIQNTARNIKDGKAKSEREAAMALATVPASKFEETRNVAYLAATIAKYYLLADDKTDDGARTRTRVKNFIAGIHDTNM